MSGKQLVSTALVFVSFTSALHAKEIFLRCEVPDPTIKYEVTFEYWIKKSTGSRAKEEWKKGGNVEWHNGGYEVTMTIDYAAWRKWEYLFRVTLIDKHTRDRIASKPHKRKDLDNRVIEHTFKLKRSNWTRKYWKLKDQMPQPPVTTDPVMMVPFKPSRTLAAVIGISQYLHAKPGGIIENLDYADDDAHGFADALRKRHIPETNIVRLIDSTKQQISEAINKLVARATPEDLVLVYVSGHGLPDGGRKKLGFFVANDTDPDTRRSSAIGMDELFTWLNRGECRRNWIIADTCYSGRMLKAVNAKGFLEDSIIAPGGANTAQVDPAGGVDPTGVLVVAAATIDGPALQLQDLKMSPVTWALIKALDGAADGVGGPKDGIVTGVELQTYVPQQLGEINAEHNVKARAHIKGSNAAILYSGL